MMMMMKLMMIWTCSHVSMFRCCETGYIFRRVNVPLFPCFHVPIRGFEKFWTGHVPMFRCGGLKSSGEAMFPCSGGGLKNSGDPMFQCSHVPMRGSENSGEPMFPCSDVPKLDIYPPSSTVLFNTYMKRQQYLALGRQGIILLGQLPRGSQLHKTKSF